MTSNEWFKKMYREVRKPAYDEFIKLYPLTLEDLPGEIWKAVPAYEDYHGSNFGRVKSFKHKTPRILTPALNIQGYLFFALYKDGKVKHFRANRLVASLFRPNPESKPQVNHRDGVKFNNHVSNLEWATDEENKRHAIQTGLLSTCGENNGRAKLTNEQIELIRLNPGGLTQMQLGELFNVDFTTIGLIQLGKRYKTAGGAIRKAQKRKVLTAEERVQVRELHRTGEYSYSELGRLFDCDRTTIKNILNQRIAHKQN